MDRDLLEVTVPHLEQLYRRHKYTVTEVVRWYIARITSSSPCLLCVASETISSSASPIRHRPRSAGYWPRRLTESAICVTVPPPETVAVGD